MDYFLFQELQSSVLAGPKIRAGKRLPTEKCAFESVLNCRFLETYGTSHTGVYVRNRYFRKASAVEMCAIQVQENAGRFKKIC